MITINGTNADYDELIKWARKRNEKLLQYIPAEYNESTQHVFIAPDKVVNWMRYNCFLGFIQEYFAEENAQ